MKRAEITVPKTDSDLVREVLKEHTDDITSTEAETEEGKAIQFQIAVDSDDIDPLTEDLKGIKELDTGELTIEIIEESARIEKGKQQEGGSMALSVQEMYTKAFEFAAYDRATWALVALGSGIAVFGLHMDNIIVVVGSMVIAPMLGPFIAASFGLVIGDRDLISSSFKYAALSLFVATSAAFVISLTLPLQINPVIRLIANPGYATIPLSLFVGAAAALTFTTEAREALAGVAVAIALVPPTAVAGMALALPDLSLFTDVFLVIVTNVMSLILAGSVTFKLFGIAPSTYYRKKVSEEQLRRALIISLTSIVIIGAIVGYFSFIDFQNSAAETTVHNYLETEMGDRLLQKQVTATADEIRVSIVVVDPRFTEAELQRELTERTDRRVDLTLIGVQGVER